MIETPPVVASAAVSDKRVLQTALMVQTPISSLTMLAMPRNALIMMSAMPL